jgi:acyl-CoA thioester hydrolase
MPRVKLDLPQHFAFTTEVPVRITDINYGGHLGNDAILGIVQEARLQFLRQRGLSEADVGGAGIIMTDAVVMYKAEAFYGDVLVVEVAIQDLQPLACDFVFRLTSKDSGKEVARAKTGIAFFDYARRRIVEAPSAFRAAFGGSQPEVET